MYFQTKISGLFAKFFEIPIIYMSMLYPMSVYKKYIFNPFLTINSNFSQVYYFNQLYKKYLDVRNCDEKRSSTSFSLEKKLNTEITNNFQDKDWFITKFSNSFSNLEKEIDENITSTFKERNKPMEIDAFITSYNSTKLKENTDKESIKESNHSLLSIDEFLREHYELKLKEENIVKLKDP